jgi:hypothetical protein
MKIFTIKAAVTFLIALTSTHLTLSQTLNLTQAGLIEGGNGIVPNLTGASSVFVAGNYAYVVGIGDVLEILDITLPGVPLHKSTLVNGEGGASILRPQTVVVVGNYAYITSYGGNALEIVDVSNPSAPVHKGSLYDGGGKAPYLNQAWGMTVVGKYAYIAANGSNALEIVDVTNPAAPVHKGSLLDGGGTAPFLQGTLSIKVVGNYAYVGGNGSFEIIDISNPALPVHVGSLLDGKGNAPYLFQVYSVDVSGKYAYVTDLAGAFDIIDVSNLALPVLKSTLKNGPVSGPYLYNPYAVSVSGNYAYVSNLTTTLIQNLGITAALEIIDISNPSLPVHKAALIDPLLAASRSLFVTDNKVYMTSRSNNSLNIVDISNLLSPSLLSTAKSGSGGALLNGAQSVYISGNYAYVACYNSNALEIIDITNPSKPVHAGSLKDGVGGAALNSPVSVVVSGNYAYVASNLSESLEIIDISIPSNPTHAGRLQLTISNINYFPNAVYVSGNYAYLVTSLPPFFTVTPGSPNGNALIIVDISNPASPVLKGSLLDGASGVVMKNPQSVFVSGTNAYIVTDNSMEIADVSNPAVPVHKSSVVDGTGGASINLGNSVYVAGGYAFVATSNGLEIVDVLNPAQPVHKGKIMDGGGSAPFLHQSSCVFVAGKYAFVTSFGSRALEVIDISNPALPTHQGSLVNGTSGALLDGPYSVFVSGNYAYIANGNLSQDLDVVYLYGPGITGFSPTGGSVGTSVTITGQNFNTFVSASINGVNAPVTAVTSTALTITVPPNVSIGKIVLNYAGQKATSTSNFIVTPSAISSTQITPSGFTANWSDVGASGYFLDVSTDNFKTFINGYSNLPVGNSSQYTITGLLSATHYQYRVRATDGVLISANSNAFDTQTIPSTPVASAATSVTESSFTAQWFTVRGANGYYLDVSQDDTFSKSFLTGYTNLAIPGIADTTQNVKGLSPFTHYYYRIRSYDSAGTSASSATIHVFTPDNKAPQITPSPANATVLPFGDTQLFTVNIQDDVRVDTARFYYKGISHQSFNSLDLHSTDGNYAVTVQSSWLDSLGLEYYFMARDEAGNKKISPTSYAQVNYPSIILPPLPSGSAQKDYRIVTFPYQLSQENLSAFYLATPWNDNTKVSIWWWDPSLKNGAGDYVKFGSGTANSFEPGKGYWVLVKNQITLQLTNVTAPEYNRSNLYAMNLKPGWNEIGNPYPVEISWQDVISFNEKNNPGANLSALILYDETGFKAATNGRLMKPFEGGFIRNLGPTDILLNIPFQGQTTIGGRIGFIGSDISQDAWNVFLHINQGDRSNELGGVGMHPQAKNGIDRFDNFNPPGFIDDPEINFTNNPDPQTRYSQDVVSPQPEYTWQFTPTGIANAPTRLTWNASIAANGKQLLLFDEVQLQIIDMTTTDHYDFTLNSKSTFRIYYGDHVEQKIFTPQIAAGEPYPNPISNESTTRINLSLPDSEAGYQVSIELYNAQGEKLEATATTLSSGIHTLEAFTSPAIGPATQPGVYIYKLSIDSSHSSTLFTGKIIKL